MGNMTEKEARSIKEQTVKLETIKNFSFILAKKMLETQGYYFCVLNGKNTEVVY